MIKHRKFINTVASGLGGAYFLSSTNALAEVHDSNSEITVSDTELRFNLRGIPIIYDSKKQEVSCLEKTASLKMQEGKIRLRMMVDRTSIDIFGNDGRLYMPMGMVVPEDNHALSMTVKGGEARIHSMNIFELNSAWTS